MRLHCIREATWVMIAYNNVTFILPDVMFSLYLLGMMMTRGTCQYLSVRLVAAIKNTEYRAFASSDAPGYPVKGNAPCQRIL